MKCENDQCLCVFDGDATKERLYPANGTDLPDCRVSGGWRWRTDRERSCIDRWCGAYAWWGTEWRSFPLQRWAGVVETSWRHCPVRPCAAVKRTTSSHRHVDGRAGAVGLGQPAWGLLGRWHPAPEWRSWACRRLSPASAVWMGSPKPAWKRESSLAGLVEWSRNSLQGLLADHQACGMHCHDSGQRSLENGPGRLFLWQPAGATRLDVTWR